MVFRPIGPGEEKLFANRLDGEFSCEFTPVCLAFWAQSFQFETAETPFGLFYRTRYRDEWYYGLPFCHDMKTALNALRDFCLVQGHPLRLYATQGARYDAFCAVNDGRYTVTPLRDGFEYLYRVSDLTELAGKKYHSKRNHIAAFSRLYDWRYETLSSANAPAVWAMADEWYREHGADENRWLKVEQDGLRRVLTEPQRYQAIGGVLWADGRVAAVTLGCRVNEDVFDVNFEKAFTSYHGAYTMINQQFVAHELQSYAFVNREDDMGEEGLRKAKLSYHPALLLEKYHIVEKES